MQNSPNDDNVSVHSDDSNISISAQKEKLNSLINMELKHSGVYRDIRFKDNLLKVDLENVNNTFQRLQSHIKKKSEQLDDLYDKLADDQKENKIRLEKKLLAILQQFAEINSCFCEAFDIYSYDVLKNTFVFCENETDNIEKNYLEVLEDLSVLQKREEIDDFIVKLKSAQGWNTNNVLNMLFEITMKRPEIELEEINTKLMQEIHQLKQIL